MSSNHFCFFLLLKTNEKNESVIKFASEMEITFLLLSVHKLRLKELYAATALCLLCSLELSLSNTESLGFHGNLSCWCLPLHWFLYLLATKSFIKILYSHWVLIENLSSDFLYSLGKMVFFIYNYFMSLLRFLSAAYTTPLTLKLIVPTWLTFSNEIPGNIRCAGAEETLHVSAHYPVLSSRIVRRAKLS